MANTLNNWATAFSSAMLGVASWLNGRKQKVTGDSTSTTVVGNFLTNLFGGKTTTFTDTATTSTASTVDSGIQTVSNVLKDKKNWLWIALIGGVLFFLKPFKKKRKTPRRRKTSVSSPRRSSKSRMPKGTRSAKARMAYVRSFRKKAKKR